MPTLAEAGVKGVDVYSWQAMAAPKGLPADVRNKIHAAAVAALRDPQVAKKMTDVGFEIVANTPEEFAKFQAASTPAGTRSSRPERSRSTDVGRSPPLRHGAAGT